MVDFNCPWNVSTMKERLRRWYWCQAYDASTASSGGRAELENRMFLRQRKGHLTSLPSATWGGEICLPFKRLHNTIVVPHPFPDASVKETGKKYMDFAVGG